MAYKTLKKQRLYMQRYRARTQETAKRNAAKLAKLQEILKRWRWELEGYEATSPRVALAARLFGDIMNVLEEGGSSDVREGKYASIRQAAIAAGPASLREPSRD